MSTKNIYLFKVVIRDTQTNTEVPVRSFKVLFQDVFDREIIFFLLSLKEMSALIRAIHSDSGAKSKKEIQELRDKVNLKRRR